MKKAVIVVYGKDKKGIIYHLTKVLYDNDINVLDIRQTIVDGIFDMMTIVDISSANKKNTKDFYDKIRKDLDALAKKMNLEIGFQLEETFLSMHQV